MPLAGSQDVYGCARWQILAALGQLQAPAAFDFRHICHRPLDSLGTSRFTDHMQVSGLALAFSGVVIGVVGELAARGTLGPNGAAGIRIKSVMKSDAAWRAGHRAARLWLDGAGLCFVGGGLLNAFATRAVANPAVLIGMAAGLALVVAGSVFASRAARRCDER